MSTISARGNTTTADGADTRTAGGKITRNRRPPPSSRTPYDRPSPSPVLKENETENPNWLSNLIYPAKVIVSGAGKIFNFFGDYSSSSEEDSENDDEEPDEVDNDGSDKVFSPPSKSANKRNIEQLVSEETFSREEGNQLIRLIKSRMVDTNGFGEGTPPTRNTAIMEARKWLQEKRSGSKKTLEAELDSSSQFTRSEKGSPADMAKSYMQNRPAWASSSSKHVEFGSPSKLGMLHFKEETPTSTLRSSELKRSTFAAGSWNLLDEIRRVRSKATEEFLATAPSTKTSLSLLSPADKQDISESKGNVEGAGPEESTHAKPDTGLHDAGATSFLRDSHDGNAAHSVEHQDHPEAVGVSVLKFNKDNEVNESRTASADNGVAAPAYVQGENGTEKHRPTEEENGNPIGSYQEGPNAHLETPDTLTDPIDNSRATATDSVINGSLNSSSLQEEDVSQDLSQPTTKGHTTRAKDALKEKKLRGFTRRGRGRGK